MAFAPNRISDYVPKTVDLFLDADLAAKGGPGKRTRRREAPSVSGLLRTLSYPTRLKLLLVLVGGEQSVNQLCRDLSMPQPTVSHHLARLRWSHLVEPRRSGKHVYYSAGPTVAVDADWLSIGTVRIRLLNDA
jgi:DNA-binding transcriptional ArsR family regulator